MASRLVTKRSQVRFLMEVLCYYFYQATCGTCYWLNNIFLRSTIVPQKLGSRFNAIWYKSTHRTHYEGISLFVLTCSLMVILLSQGHVTVCKCIGQSIAGLQMTDIISFTNTLLLVFLTVKVSCLALHRYVPTCNKIALNQTYTTTLNNGSLSWLEKKWLYSIEIHGQIFSVLKL